MIQGTQQPALHGKKTAILLILAVMAFLVITTSGCIRLMQPSSASNTAKTTEALYPNPGKTTAVVSPVMHAQKIPAAQATYSVTASTPDFVSDAAPVLPPDPYLIQHALRINETPLTSSSVQYPEFTRTYALRGNSVGLVVNATALEGPLRIHFDVRPLFDCLEDPESCRGEPEKSISLPYFTLTVRDNRTREIVAEDGYGRVYSSQKDNRTITLYHVGRYHLTLTGNSVDVNLSITNGAAPPVQETHPSSTGPAPPTTMSPEYLRYLRQSGRVV